ncbi:MAG: hypothetical protein D6702_02665 [Planctomycetota bacterium]|nr:MAG: hypothetical protein D6702_02665 [Planctomycetota bacterium]
MSPSQQSLEQVQILFTRLPETWVVGLVLAPAVVLLSLWAYRRPERGPRRLLAALRLLLLALAVTLALGPVLRRSEVVEEPAPLALLADDSASLQRRDALPPDALERLREAGIAVGAEPSRLEVLRGLLAGDWRRTLEDRYALQVWRFSDRLAPAAVDGSDLAGEGRGTALGAALEELAAEYRGRRLPDMVLLSDGRNNLGPDPERAAARLAAEGVKVHVVALGDPRPAPDLRLERVQAPDVVLAGDEAVFTLRLRAAGDELPKRVTVRLRDENGQVLDEATVAPAGEEGVRFPLTTVLRRPGLRDLRAEVDPLPGEHARDDNVLDLPVEVREVLIRVLYVEGRPRYEYRFLRSRLIAADESSRDIDARIWLTSADRGFPQESSDPSQRLRRVPLSAEELLRDFDVVILGDVDPARLGSDPLDGARFAEALHRFVRRGGGLLFLAGPRANPAALLGTPLEELLPVVVGHQPAPDDLPFRAVPADPELPHPVVRLAATAAETMAIWSQAAPLHWFQPVEGLRPGAQAWLVHDQAANRNGPLVIAAGAFYPEGRVGWLGSDETWRWRDPNGEALPQRFWRGLLRFLAAGRLRGEEGRARLDLDRSRIELGESVTVEARLRDEDWQPELSETGVLAFAGGVSIGLAPVPESPGVYRGVFRPASPGRYEIVLPEDGTAEGEPLASARLAVVLPSAEMRLTAQDRPALERIAGRTGGRLVDADRADELLATLDGRERRTRTLASDDRPLDGAGALALFLALAASEWLLRKRSNLS